MIEYFVIPLSILDLFLSYLYLKQFIHLFPEKNYVLLEANPLIKLGLKWFGFPKGMFFSMPFVVGAWYIIITLLNTEWLSFACGMLTMMIMYHWLNFNQLKDLKNNRLKDLRSNPEYIKAQNDFKESLRKC